MSEKSSRYLKTKSTSKNFLPSLIIFIGIAALATAIILLKHQPAEIKAPVDKSLEAQFDTYLEEGKPVFAFFHSTTCQSCIDMMKIVAEVYPEFAGSVEIVDVDVYDARNENLLRRAGIRSIPTLIFFNCQGEGYVSIGVMEADQLRLELTTLKESK
jgi:thiol-disulfide isomerase/thioredoxin